MIPYWHWTTQPIPLFAGLEFHMFGLMVGLAVLFGTWLAQRRASEAGLNPLVMGDLAIFMIIVAFFMAHQVSLFFYFPERVFGTPCPDGVCPIGAECLPRGRCDDGSILEILYIWSGISSFGGFLGTALALVIFFRVSKIKLIPGILELRGGKGLPAMKYMDALAYAFALAWVFGRMGCFFAHDHIGMPTDSIIAVNFPDGFRGSVPAVAEFGEPGYTPRYDLGMMEVPWAIGMFLMYHLWARRKPDLRPGWYAAVMMFTYAPYRFWLDTLRATDIGGADTRYFADVLEPGITPGQIGAIAVFVLGLVVWFKGGQLMRKEGYMSGEIFSGQGRAEGGDGRFTEPAAEKKDPKRGERKRRR